MSETEAGALAALSRATAAAVAGAAARVVGLTDGRRRLSGLIWSEGRIVTAEECLDGDDGITALLPDGSSVPVELAGRDPSTDVALLRAETGPQPDWPAARAAGGRAPSPARSGAAATARSPPSASSPSPGRPGPAPPAAGSTPASGSPSRCRRRSRAAPRSTPKGGLLGLAVADPRRRALVIPAATVGRAGRRARRRTAMSGAAISASRCSRCAAMRAG